MSEQEEDSFINYIWIEKRSMYDQDGKYGKDTYFLTLKFCFNEVLVRDLVFEDLENLHKLLGKVLAIERGHCASSANPIEKTEK